MFAKLVTVAACLAVSEAHLDDETLLLQVSSTRAHRDSLRTDSSLESQKNMQPPAWACSCEDWVKIPCHNTVDCNGHGTTIDDDASDGCSCVCDAGYQPPDCTPIPCDAQDHCNGHGRTVDMDRADGCACSCEDGWSGTTCLDPKICEDFDVVEVGGARWEVRLQWSCGQGAVITEEIYGYKDIHPGYRGDGGANYREEHPGVQFPWWVKLGKPGYKADLNFCAAACVRINTAAGEVAQVPITSMSMWYMLDDQYWDDPYERRSQARNWGNCECLGSLNHGRFCGPDRHFTHFNLQPDDTPITCKEMYAVDPLEPNFLQTRQADVSNVTSAKEAHNSESQALEEAKQNWDASRPGIGGRCITWKCESGDVTCPEVSSDLVYRIHWREYVADWHHNVDVIPEDSWNSYRRSYERTSRYDIAYNELDNLGNPEEALWGALVPIPSDLPAECLTQLDINAFLDALCVTYAYQSVSLQSMARRTLVFAATEANLTAAAYGPDIVGKGGVVVDGRGPIVVAGPADFTGGVRYFERATIPWGPDSADDFHTCYHGHCGRVLCLIDNFLWG